MKVLLDVNVSNDFRDGLADALGLPDAVVRVHDEGWRTKRNGALQEAASAKGYTCLVTHDKDMAQRHPPHIPVLVLDDPNHGEEGRDPDSMTADEVRRMTLAGASAVADVLLREHPTVKGYTAVPIPGYRPRKALRRILDGEHKQHPDYERNRQRRAEMGKSKARSS